MTPRLEKVFAGVLAVVALVVTGACDGSGGAKRLEDPKARAATLWEHRCAACHGPTGKGDGPSVPGIRIVPPDMSLPAWQRAWSDERIANIIVNGGPAEGRSHVMSPNPDLAADPEGVAELVKVVRGLEAKSGGGSAPR